MKTERTKDQNPDPITGAPGAHPVGTGVGATAGGAAGGLIGAAAGPVGAAIGVAAGAIAGGLAGKGVAERINPTEEEAYWRTHHDSQEYAAGRGYDRFRSAYQTGYMGYDTYGRSGRRFEDVENDLRSDYERQAGTDPLAWTEARAAARAAWDRVDRRLERIIGYSVVDNQDEKVGTVSALWQDSSGEVAFVGVKTGWLGLGRDHVMPAEMVRMSQAKERIRIPVDEDVVKNAPVFDSDRELSPSDQRQIREYYQAHGWASVTAATAGGYGTEDSVSSKTTPEPPQYGGPAGTASTAGSTGLAGESSYGTGGTVGLPRSGGTSMKDTGAGAGSTRDEVRMPLSEEKVHVGVREVESGGIRLRKIVRTEVVNQPVELRREEAVVERVPASGETTAGDFEEDEVYIPLRREEPVITKEARVREEIRVRKSEQRESQTVSTDIRKEDVDIDEQNR